MHFLLILYDHVFEVLNFIYDLQALHFEKWGCWWNRDILKAVSMVRHKFGAWLAI
jgi:hypothetical protein